jgi:serine beta-lactamase-like protein LACTB, mitochondrial
MPLSRVFAVLPSLLLLAACQSRAAVLPSLNTNTGISAQSSPFNRQNQQSPRENLDQVIQNAMQQQQLVGLALGVVENGQITYLKGYGLADNENQQPVTPDSSFRWASISKTVTSVLSMQLVEQGKLNLESPIQTYWPQYRNAQGWPVTQRQLLSHLAGVGSYDDVPGWRDGLKTYQARSLPAALQGADMLQASADVFAFAPLMSPPGSAYRYSTFGSMLAGAVITQAGNAPYLQQFEQRIRQPLGLTSMQPDQSTKSIPYRVSGYYREQGQIKQRSNDDVAWKLAGGGFTSNVGDLTRYMQALINQELLPAAAHQEMWTSQTTSEGKKTGYGLSFSVARHGQDTEIGHFGSQEKTRTVLSFLPEKKLGVVIMCNSEWANLGPVRDALLNSLKSQTLANNSRALTSSVH